MLGLCVVHVTAESAVQIDGYAKEREEDGFLMMEDDRV